MATAYALPALLNNGLSKYLAAIAKIPVLSLEKEQDLANDYIISGNPKAAEELVLSHLKLAAKVAFSFRRYGLPIADLISEANLGLMQAVKKFDPTKGCRLSTYAVWWIKANLHDYILKSWSLVKMGTVAVQKRLFYNLRKIKAHLGIYNENHLSDDQVKLISAQLDASPEEVIEMNARLMGDQSLNAPVRDEDTTEKGDMLVDGSPTAETVLMEREEKEQAVGKLNKAFKALNARELDIFKRRKLAEEPETLETLSVEYGISRERVRQIEERAYAKVKNEILNPGVEILAAA